MLLIMALGTWWLYLVVKLSDKLGKGDSFLNMAKWEGSTFLVFLLLISAALFYFYYQDLKKANSLQAFFASLTHELKTPLASIRLQAEVINSTLTDERSSSLVNRLIEDTQTLEDELDKILQLSRMERGGQLNITSIDLRTYLHKFNFSYPQDQDYRVQADEFALKLIIRNLLDNTAKHCRNPQQAVDINLYRENKKIVLHYNDHGSPFTGDPKKLGNLFYKHDSSKGSGIGLYLIKKLMLKMQGNCEILSEPNLQFKLTFIR